jgi:hypothetical protein
MQVVKTWRNIVTASEKKSVLECQPFLLLCFLYFRKSNTKTIVDRRTREMMCDVSCFQTCCYTSVQENKSSASTDDSYREFSVLHCSIIVEVLATDVFCCIGLLKLDKRTHGRLIHVSSFLTTPSKDRRSSTIRSSVKILKYSPFICRDNKILSVTFAAV